MTSFKQLTLAAALAASLIAPALAAPQTYVVDSSHTFRVFLTRTLATRPS